MHRDFCVENVQPKLTRPAILRQVLDFNERTGLDILSLRNSFPDDHTAVVGYDDSGLETSISRGWQR